MTRLSADETGFDHKVTGRICAAWPLRPNCKQAVSRPTRLLNYLSLKQLTGSTLITLYGISNCDSVKKAKQWLSDNNIVYAFHDFRTDGLTAEQINTWLKHVPSKTLLNKRSTTWKQLPDTLKNQLAADNAPLPLLVKTMVEQPTLVKRPVLVVTNNNIKVGFSAADYQQLLN